MHMRRENVLTITYTMKFKGLKKYCNNLALSYNFSFLTCCPPNKIAIAKATRTIHFCLFRDQQNLSGHTTSHQRSKLIAMINRETKWRAKSHKTRRHFNHTHLANHSTGKRRTISIRTKVKITIKSEMLSNRTNRDIRLR